MNEIVISVDTTQQGIDTMEMLQVLVKLGKGTINHAIIFNANSDETAALIRSLPGVIQMTGAAAPAPEQKKTHPQKPNGKCLKCFREAIIVKSSGLCKPCHMLAMREKQHLGLAEVSDIEPESVYCDKCSRQVPKVNKHGLCPACAIKGSSMARLQDGIDRVVEKAQAGGSIGGVSVEKTIIAKGHSLRVRKLG